MLTFIRCPFYYRVTAVARKIPRSFSAGGRLHLTHTHTHTHTLLTQKKSEWADYAAVQTYCGNLSRNDLTLNLSGNTQPQSHQFAEPLWTDSGLKRGIIVRGHDFYSKRRRRRKKRRRAMNSQIFSQNPRKRGKKHVLACRIVLILLNIGSKS